MFDVGVRGKMHLHRPMDPATKLSEIEEGGCRLERLYAKV